MRRSHKRLDPAPLVSLLLLGCLMSAAQAPSDLPGLVVEEVIADSAAASAGVKVGDRLLTYDAKLISSPAGLQAAEENTFGEKPRALRIGRAGKTLTLLLRGKLGVEVRPELPSIVLSGYEEGKSALNAQKTEMVIALWTVAAKAAQQTGANAVAAWLYGRIGQIHERLEHWTEARLAYAASWELLISSSDSAGQSRILAGLGRCCKNLNDFPAAEGWFNQARRVNAAAGYEMWAAADLHELGLAAYTRGELAAAQDYHSQALAIRERLAPNSLDVAASFNSLGNAAWSRGDLADLEAAHDYYNRALVIRERLAPDSLEVAASFNNLGNVASTRGGLTAAQAYFQKALAIYERLAPTSVAIGAILNNLGEVARTRGDLTAAHVYLSLALETKERRAPNSLTVAVTLNNLGTVDWARGDLVSAQDEYRRSLAINERLAPESLAVAASLNNLGEIASARSDHSAAQEYHRRALSIRERRAPDSLVVATSLANLGEVAREGGDHPMAWDYHGRALAIKERLAPDSLVIAESLNSLGAVALARGDDSAARDHHNRALAIRERLAPNSLAVAESLTAFGELLFREHLLADARSLFARAVSIIEAQRGQITSTDARALLLARYTKLYVSLLRTHVALNDIPAAFATFERARARSLVELLAERRLDFRADAPVDLLAQQDVLDEKRSATYRIIAKTFSELTSASAALRTHDLNNDPKRMRALEASVATFEQRLEELRESLAMYGAEQQRLETQIRRSSPRLAALQYPEPLDVPGARAALDAGTLLLAYVVDEEKTYLFALTKTDLKLLTLPIGRASLGRQVTVFRELVAKERLGDLILQGGRLYDTLVRPAQNWVSQAQRVLICPDGPLQVLPFAALVSQAGPRQRYFIEDKPLHTISSVTVYAETRRSAMERHIRRAAGEARPGWTLLGFGDPLYTKAAATPASEGKLVRRASVQHAERHQDTTELTYLRRRGLGLIPLPRTRDEVEAIVGLFGKSARAKLGSEATETVVKREAKNAGILHFASHGWMDEVMGLSSGLALSQPEALGREPTADDDGLLQAWEIFEHVRVNADLVVLSACQTALGQDLNGEGLIGLTRAFLYAGAQSVVVSLWDVSDVGAAEFMKAFYQELRKGATKDVALQRAMTTMYINPTRRHPFYWAAFILVGDWR